MAKQLPDQAQVVIIGGGIIGCSVAYHLTKLGWKDVILLERKVLTCGTTWAAAGLVGLLRATAALTRLAQYGARLYASLEEETEQATGYTVIGALMVARTQDRIHEYERGAAMARSFGIEMERISFQEALKLWPLMNTDDLTAVYYLPQEARTNPVDTTQALARGARMGGARIFEGVKVTGLHLDRGAVSAVSTDQGRIKCQYLVNCAGMWARELAEMVGVSVPLHAAEHMHIVTEPMEGVYPGMPSLRDMDAGIYFREEVGGLMMGGFEPVAKPWGMKGIPEDFQFNELNEDWDHFEYFTREALKRCPAIGQAQVRHLTSVPESFTPDNAYMLGEAPGVKNFFVAAGMNSVGIASAAGVGKALAEWIVNGLPTEDLWGVDIRRCQGWQINRRYLYDRTEESLGLLYAHHWPFRQPRTARPVRVSPLHDRLAARGACWGVVAGWERANWFAPAGAKPEYDYGWGRQNWFAPSAAEHRAVREGVGVFDLSSSAKFLLQGPGAEAALQQLCANDLAVPEGRVVSSPLLNERGGIEADLTVTRLDEESYFIVGATASEVRDFDWLSRRLPRDGRAVLTNVTSAYAVLGLMGPRSRDLLSKLTSADLSNQAFPFLTARRIDVAYARPLALRRSSVGELGWELYIPTEFAPGIFDALLEEGQAFELKLVGLQAVDSLRLEKGHPLWGADLSPDYTPLEAGLDSAVYLDKGDFIGREALLAQRERGLRRRLVMFALEDPEPLLFQSEPIYRDGELLSANTHGAYAHTLGRAMGMGYLANPQGPDEDWIMSGRYEIDIEGRLYPARPHLRAPYDPEGERMRV